MTASSRKARASETQRIVAAYFAEHGWPYCTDQGAGRQGSDLLGVPGLAVEIKARRGLDLPAWLRQATREKGLPIVVHRPDGFGPASIELWPATMPLGEFVRLLRQAGYGDPEIDPTTGA